MTKRKMSEIEVGGGTFMGFVSAMADVLHEKGMPYAVIHRLARPSGRATLEKMVDLAHADWRADLFTEALAKAEQLASAEAPDDVSGFTALIVYVQPKFKELERQFPSFVDPNYKGKRFDPIEHCKDVSRENREVAFEYVFMDRNASTDEVLAEMDRRDLLPARYEELLGFARQYPDEQRKHRIVALGSETRVLGYRNIASLCGDYAGRGLFLYRISDDWDDDIRFLAVRKDPVATASAK